ncbi:MAG: hypothetical protein HRT94_00040 [Alphaproteobacteria bacterium]|nr:hypothetical protein [Alphaproteobacteria bacterium]
MNLLKKFALAASFAVISSPALPDEAPSHQAVEDYEFCANVFTELRSLQTFFDLVEGDIETEESKRAFNEFKREFEPNIRGLQEKRDIYCTRFIA